MASPILREYVNKDQVIDKFHVIATVAIMAVLGIIGAAGQQQQMASASISNLADEVEQKVRENVDELRDGVVEREICPDQIFVKIAGDGYVCIPKFDFFPE